MSRTSSNIISFDGSSRASSRASRDVVESRAVRYNESASSRARDVSVSSGRVNCHAVGETSSARGLDYSQSIDSLSSDRFARGERARFSKVTRSGRIQPIVESPSYDNREASFAASSRVSSRPARSSRSGSNQAATRSSGFDLGAFSAFDDLDEQLFGDSSMRSSSRRSARSEEARSSRAASAQPRAAVEMFDPNDVENDEDESSYGSRLSKKERRQKSKAKAKAEKLFNRQFGGDAGAPAQAGSRAAVYKGEMGRSHKRAFNDLGGASENRNVRGGRGASAASRASQEKAHLSTSIWIYALGLLVCIAAALWFLYPMAQQYYVGLRTQDRLEAEYALLSERNAAIQSDIDRLSTDEGIEDVAREQLGWVSKGETAGVVVGPSEEETSPTPDTVHTQIDSSSVKTPDTWYSGVLDPIFGYSDTQ